MNGVILLNKILDAISYHRMSVSFALIDGLKRIVR